MSMSERPATLLPAVSKTERGARYSASAPDIVSPDTMCKNRLCRTKNAISCTICYHRDCRKHNGGEPWQLCRTCDDEIHRDCHSKSHLRRSVRWTTSSTEDMASQDSTPDSDIFLDDTLASTQPRRFSSPACPGDRHATDEFGDLPTPLFGDDSATTGVRTHDVSPVMEEVVVADTITALDMGVPGIFSKHFLDSNKPDKPDKKLRRSGAVKQRVKSTFTGQNDYFTLQFATSPKPDLEVVAATQGITLRESLTTIFERRRLNFETTSLYAETSKTPLPLRTDTYLLGGHLVRAETQEKDVDPTNRASVKAGRTSSGTKPEKKAPARVKRPASDDATSVTSVDRQTKSQNRLSNIFNSAFGGKPPALDSVEKEKLEILYDRLQQYSSEGLPMMPDLMMIGLPKFDEALYELEDHWTHVVTCCESLDKRQRNQQEALWELLKTEVVYIHSIKVVIDVFLCCLINLQNDLLLNEIDTSKLFSNILEILNVNCRFWEEYLLPVLTEARRTGQLLQPSLLHEGFQRFNDDFQPYIRYCLDQEPAIQYLREQYRDNELFKIFVNWAETQKQCKRLRLSDLLVKPMQRLTKYSLLLNAVMKKTESESDTELLEDMITNMDRFVMHVNSSLRQRQEKARLLSVQERIDSYDVVDILNDESSKLLSEYCQLDLMCPMPGCHPQQIRQILCEGALKFKDGIARSQDVYCFLFTDMLLITKTKRGDKVKVIKPPIRVDQALVHELKDGGLLIIMVNEYKVATSAYTFQGEQIKIWVEKLKKAQMLYREHLDKAQNGLGEIEIIYDDIESLDESLAFPSSALLSVPMQLKPSASHEDLPSRASCSDSDFSPVLNISRAKSTECLFVRASDRGYNTMPNEKRSEFLAKTHMFNQTIQDEINDDHKSEIRLHVPRRGSGPKESHYLLVPSDQGDSRKTVLTIQRRDVINRSVSVPAVQVPNCADSASFPETGSPSRSSPVDGKIFFEDEPRAKLNQRRLLRSERRYYTADAIDTTERDPSIHKRLSWNLGNGQADICNYQVARLRATSSDSLRSVVSSSGCSSLGSLHMSPEAIDESTTVSSPDSVCSVEFSPGRPVQFTITLPERAEPQQRPSSTTSLQEPSLSLDSAEIISKDGRSRAKENSKSRSLTDLTSTSEIKDGVASVTFTLEANKEKLEKLSPSKLLRLKKQLLLNSDAHASNV